MRNHKLAIGLGTALLAMCQNAHAATCYAFSAVFEAVASSSLGGVNAPIQSARTVYVRDLGLRTNAFEFLIQHPGDPNVSIQATDLEIMTNSAFARNAGIAANQIDLAQAWITPGSDGVTPVYVFQLLADAANIQPPPNFLAVPGQGGNIGGICFVPGLWKSLRRAGAKSHLADLVCDRPLGLGVVLLPAHRRHLWRAFPARQCY